MKIFIFVHVLHTRAKYFSYFPNIFTCNILSDCRLHCVLHSLYNISTLNRSSLQAYYTLQRTTRNRGGLQSAILISRNSSFNPGSPFSTETRARASLKKHRVPKLTVPRHRINLPTRRASKSLSLSPSPSLSLSLSFSREVRALISGGVDYVLRWMTHTGSFSEYTGSISCQRALVPCRGTFHPGTNYYN